MYNNDGKPKNRDHTNIVNIAKTAHTLKRYIKAINIETNEESYLTAKISAENILEYVQRW